MVRRRSRADDGDRSRPCGGRCGEGGGPCSAEAARFHEALSVGGRRFAYVSLTRALPDAALAELPRSLKILFENVARNSPEDLASIDAWRRDREGAHEIPFFPNRVLMHDTTCVPALADFAAMRDAVAALGGDPQRINPAIPVHLVIDHSVMVDHYGKPDAVELNLAADFKRNSERYRFVKWAEKSLANFKVVPPRHRHPPPGERRAAGGRGQGRGSSGRAAARASRCARRHGQPHPDGERARRPRLGRRRDRRPGRDGRAADRDPDPARRGRPARRPGCSRA